MRLQAQHPFAPQPARDAGPAKRLVVVGGIVGLVVALVAIAAYKLRDRPEDLVRPQPPSQSTQGEAGAGGKIADRIGVGTATPGSAPTLPGVPTSTANRNDAAKSSSGPVNPPIPVARRAALLVEAPEEKSKVKTFLGTVVWRVDNVSSGPDEPLSSAVRAQIDIPEEKLQAAMTVQKNFDGTLPASHTMKLMFAVPQAPLGNIQQISVLQMRREDFRDRRVAEGDYGPGHGEFLPRRSHPRRRRGIQSRSSAITRMVGRSDGSGQWPYREIDL